MQHKEAKEVIETAREWLIMQLQNITSKTNALFNPAQILITLGRKDGRFSVVKTQGEVQTACMVPSILKAVPVSREFTVIDLFKVRELVPY